MKYNGFYIYIIGNDKSYYVSTNYNDYREFEINDKINLCICDPSFKQYSGRYKIIDKEFIVSERDETVKSCYLVVEDKSFINAFEKANDLK
ncbi:MAG: hypothetical protein LC122_02635 [Chitinophagales bacterium]|nr:hypothetical protein [Chitinophagales bacterium]